MMFCANQRVMTLAELPIDALVPEIVGVLREQRVVVLVAPPGAGKSTRVPSALVDAGLGEIVVLEPRRLAARMAAERVAAERGERIGGKVGYQIRFEDRTSDATRVTFLTEGILTRRLLRDPTLASTGVVVLDEFHERHLHGDLALAWVRRLAATSRPDLRLVVMSATLDAEPIARALGARAIRSEGRAYEVTVTHAEGPDDRKLELRVAGAVRSLDREDPRGDVLVFLPGAAEIRRAADAVADLAVKQGRTLFTLHGDLDFVEQRRAVLPHDRPKIILATNIAESSVTIDGVTGVVDSGLARRAGHDPWSGLPVLRTVRVSKASAVQRAGRAGRTRPGRAVRLYTRADLDGMPDHDVPEIRRSDLAETALAIAALGDPPDIPWLDAPPADAWREARELLRALGAVDEVGGILPLGRALLSLPLHPRLGRVAIEGARLGCQRDAARLAALLGERDLRAARARVEGREHTGATERSDALLLLDLHDEAEAAGFAAHALRAIGVDAGVAQSARKAARRVEEAIERADLAPTRAPSGAASKTAEEAMLRAILAGFPDRVARRLSPGSRSFEAAGGGHFELSAESAVREAPWICAVGAGSDDRGRGAAVPRIRVASAIEPEWLIDAFPADVKERSVVAWDRRARSVIARSQLLYRGLVLVESPELPAEMDASRLLFAAAEAAGARAFAPEGALDRWLARVRFAATQDPGVTAVSDADVLTVLRDLCDGRSTFAELEGAGLLHELAARFGAGRDLDRLAPERVRLPSGREARIEYEAGVPPWTESYLQDFCGLADAPRAGRVPLVLHLLAPNRRAVQVTSDLAGFWVRHYPAIRRELMRKYPRHAWPEDPSMPVPARTRR